MMAKLALNEADKWTDNTLDEIVEHLDSVYRKAYKEMSEERRKSFSAFLKSDKKKLKDLNDGLITQEEYKMWRIGWLNSDLRMRTLIDDYAQKITDTNVIASDYINDVTPEIFAYNHNYTAYEFEKGTGIAFTIVDKNTVKELATGKNHIEFRTLSVDKKKDYAWNRKKIQQALTSGIVQGKSIPKIAKDFYEVMGSNKKSAVRNARTAVTSAQNGGRQRGFEQAHDNGIKFKKEWLSAHDGRVRDSHAHLDGVKVEYNKKFPNGLMYPADPSGRPEEVYNCRCTLIADVLGIRGKRTENTVESYQSWLNRKISNMLESDDSLDIMSFKRKVQDSDIKALRNVVGFEKIGKSLRDQDGYMISKATDQLIALENRFQIIHNLESSAITSVNNSGVNDAFGYVDLIGENPKAMKLHLCDNGFSNKRNAIELVKKNVLKRNFMPCKESNYDVYTVTHEYGHMIQNSIVANEFNPTSTDDYNKVYALHREELMSIAKSIDSSIVFKSVISKYGAKDGGEFFAECFANSQLGEPNVLGEAMKIWLRRRNL